MRSRLLRNNVRCIHCNIEMNLSEDSSRGDGYKWICQNKHCSHSKTTIGLRVGSFFEGFKSDLKDICAVMFCWLLEKPAKTITADFGINKNIITKVFHKLRGVISNYLESDPVRLDGPGIIFQIDESLFSHKVKTHKGRAPTQQVWVFGIVDTSTKPCKGYMEIVESRSAESLLPIIQRVCRPGTIVHSDEWAAYRQIHSRLGFQHNTVNHSVNFVDGQTGVHTQAIESWWVQRKMIIKAMKGIRREHLSGLINEMVWRSNNRGDVIRILMALLKADD
jgi:hypothetical protein